MAFRLLTILKWARRVMGILPLPEWTDVDAVRHWVIKALGLADELADETATQIDDNIVAALRKIVADGETWTAFYTLIVDLLGATGNYDSTIEAAAEKAGVDFSVFRQLIDMILEFIEWWRNRD